MIFLINVLCLLVDQNTTKLYWCSLGDDDKPVIHVNEDKTDKSLAYAYWEEDSLFSEGWYKLHIHGEEKSKSYNDSLAIMKCIGYLEGKITANEIYNHFYLLTEIKGYATASNKSHRVYTPKVKQFLQDNLRYIRTSIEAYSEVKFWSDIGLFMAQFDGLQLGYADSMASNQSAQLDELDHWFFQSAGDMFDIAAMYKDKLPSKEFFDHCSGLVRLAPGYEDIYFAHVAWTDYRELHGQLKEYHIPIPEFNSKRVMISTRIGKLSSYDDFYVTDSGLFVFETTLNNYNKTLYERVTPNAVFTWLRAIRATWVSTNGSDWCNNFIMHNSGTYNNQYVIVDSNKFERGKKPDKDLLWVIEQLPGEYVKSDLSDILVDKGYFPSFNVPYFEYIYDIGGYPELVKSLGIYGGYRSYYNNPRYQQFAREAPYIKSFDDFKMLMRYNQYNRDHTSQGDPAQAIASRYDLRPSYGTPYGARGSMGALDAKCLRLTEAKTLMRIHAIASPPYSNQENSPLKPWEFGVEPFEHISYDGLPKKWEFNWTTFAANDYTICNATTASECTMIPLCGWCKSTEQCIPGDSSNPFFDKCKSWYGSSGKKGLIIGIVIGIIVVGGVIVFFIVRRNRKLKRMRSRSLTRSSLDFFE